MKSSVKRAPKSLRIIEAFKAKKTDAQIRASFKVGQNWINLLRREEGFVLAAPAKAKTAAKPSAKPALKAKTAKTVTKRPAIATPVTAADASLA